jgi:hypothetical protein
MMKPKQLVDEITRLIRYCVWGQMIGYISFGLSLAIEDAPDIFARANPWELVWPVLLLVAMHLFRLDSIIARLTPTWFIIVTVLSISLGTLVASGVGVRNVFGIPDLLMTDGWRYSQSSTLITLSIFVLSMIVSVYLSIRIYQMRDEIKTHTPNSNK